TIALVSMRDLAFEWLDWILKGKDKPALLKDKVSFQVMGTNSWWYRPSIQAMSNQNLRLYLDHNMLSEEKPETTTFETMKVDFTDRTNMNNYFHPMLIIDSLDASNGLVFSSGKFPESFILNGAFTGRLSVSTNKEDMDL